MKNDKYVILTDSSCDLPAPLAEDLGVEVVNLSVIMKGKKYYNYLDGREINIGEFYRRLREGETVTTSAVNSFQFRTTMEPILEEGKDILYIGFSGGLSGTCSVGAAVGEELGKRYPERKIYAVDTLGASLGQGMIVYYAVKKKEAGGSIEEVRDFVEKERLHMCHWFTVDDLNHLKLGGRISAATAAVGTMLDIKPVMHMDDAGHLVAVGKVRGRKTSLKKLVSNMENSAINPAGQTVFISHGDCIEDAEYVAKLVKERMGVKEVIINYVGPVIGTHSGPGTVALFFWGTER